MNKFKVNLNEEFWIQFSSSSKVSKEELLKVTDYCANNGKLLDYHWNYSLWRLLLATIEKRLGYVPVVKVNGDYHLNTDVVKSEDYQDFCVWDMWIYDEEITNIQPVQNVKDIDELGEVLNLINELPESIEKEMLKREVQALKEKITLIHANNQIKGITKKNYSHGVKGL